MTTLILGGILVCVVIQTFLAVVRFLADYNA